MASRSTPAPRSKASPKSAPKALPPRVRTATAAYPHLKTVSYVMEEKEYHLILTLEQAIALYKWLDELTYRSDVNAEPARVLQEIREMTRAWKPPLVDLVCADQTYRPEQPKKPIESPEVTFE